MGAWRGVVIVLAAVLTTGCGHRESREPPRVQPPKVEAPSWDPVTRDILHRRPVSAEVQVYQILLAYGKPSPRFGKEVSRSQKEAAELVKKILNTVKAAPDRLAAFRKAMEEYSDDPDTGPGALPITVGPGAFQSQAAKMALRLHKGEIAVAETELGYHIILRPKKEPGKLVLVSKDILARPAQQGTFKYKQIIIAWRDLRRAYEGRMTEGGLKRSRAEAYQLAKKILEALRKGASMSDYSHLSEQVPLVRRFGHHHGPDKKVEIPAVGQLVSRMKPGEVGVVTTPLGYHIVKRVK